MSFLQRLVDAEASRFSFEAVFGAQWDVAPSWHLGVVARSPRWTVWESAETDNSTAVVSGGASVTPVTVTRVEHDLLNSTGTGLTMPPRLYVGVARRTASSEMAAEIDVRPPVFSEFKAHSWAVNGRVGWKQRLNQNNQLGVGLFTDQGGLAPPRAFPDTRVDYFGATVGWKRRSSVKLRSGERATTLNFATTVALRYALGVGEATTIRFDYTSAAATGLVDRIDDERVDAFFHELSLYLGTSLEF